MSYEIRSYCRFSRSEWSPRRDPALKLKHHVKKVLMFLEPRDVLASSAAVSRQWHRFCKDEALVRQVFIRIFPSLASNVRLEDIKRFFRGLGPRIYDVIYTQGWASAMNPENLFFDELPYPGWQQVYRLARLDACHAGTTIPEYDSDLRDIFDAMISDRWITVHDVMRYNVFIYKTIGKTFSECVDDSVKVAQKIDYLVLEIQMRVVSPFMRRITRDTARSINIGYQFLRNPDSILSSTETDSVSRAKIRSLQISRTLMDRTYYYLWKLLGSPEGCGIGEAVFHDQRPIFATEEQRSLAIRSAFGDTINEFAAQRLPDAIDSKPFPLLSMPTALIQHGVMSYCAYPEWVNCMRTCKQLRNLIKPIELSLLRNTFPTLMPKGTLKQIKSLINGRLGMTADNGINCYPLRISNQLMIKGNVNGHLWYMPDRLLNKAAYYMWLIIKREGLLPCEEDSEIGRNALIYPESYPRVQPYHRAEALRCAFGEILTEGVQAFRAESLLRTRQTFTTMLVAIYCAYVFLNISVWTARKIY